MNEMILGVIVSVLIGGVFALAWLATLTHRRLAITLIVLSILGPAIPTPFIRIRPEELVVLVLLPFILARLRTRWNRIDVCFGLVGVSTVLSMLWGTIGKGISFSPRDLMELVKLAKFWVFFRLALYRWTEDDLGSITRWLVGSMGLAALIGIVQGNNFLGIGGLTKAFYGQDLGHVESDRVIGTMTSPIYFSMLMATGMAFAVNVEGGYRRRLFSMVLAGLYGVASVLTISRSGILGMVVALAVVVGLRLAMRPDALHRRLGRVMGLLIVLAVVGLISGTWLLGQLESLEGANEWELLRYARQGLLYRMVARFSESEESRDIRVSIWQENLENFSQSPILGWGPAKSSQATVTDNGYVLTLRRYGLLGMACYLLLYWQVLRFCWKLLHAYPYRSPQWTMALSILSVTAAYLASNVFIETFYELQLMSLFWLMVGVGYSSALVDLQPGHDKAGQAEKECTSSS
ncbi:MAG: O-antigen ligase family protein [Thermoflexales bacterium]|nr:O-antigen ligase family protein [Thermoflexales bacterium]